MKTTADLAKEAAISRRPEFLFGLYFTNRDDDSLDTVEDEIPRGDVLLERVDCEAAEAAERHIDAYI